ncbi:MAG: sporulation protein YqfD [Clostridiales bacterium]|nr:sporulation protein YqfD [Clostridiales bacterium]
MKVNLLERAANYLYGYCLMRVDGYAERALTAMMRSEINYWGLTRREETIFFYIPCREKRRLRAALADCRCRVEQMRICGAMNTVKRYKGRPGLIVGALIFASVLWASTYFVWDISVTGNKDLTEWQIIDSFAPYGVKYGAFIPSLDLDRLCHEYLIDSEEIGWVSVNLSGTCANIVVRERTDKGEVWQDSKPSNLIATEDGQITGFCVWSGESKVSIGQVVTKGEVLVSGVSDRVEMDGTVSGYTTDRSYGSVFAEVYREYTVEVPLHGQSQVYTGHEETEKHYRFFTQDLNFFGKTKNSFDTCDQIVDYEQVMLFDFLKLPIFVTTSVYKEYELVDYALEEEQAKQMAEAKMMKLLADELKDCELVSKINEGELVDDVYILTCKVYCIADIAKEMEIDYSVEQAE